MDKLKEALVDLVEPDFGLLDALLANELLCNRKYAEVRSMPTVYKRNERLLKFIRAHKMEDKFDRFNEALELASQIHVVNFIRKNGIKSEDNDFCWPLSPKERQTINRNRFHLVNMIEPGDGLLTGLFSYDVINQRQSEFILSCPPRSEKVEALLEILLRRSVRDLSVTVKCLREVLQNNVADILCRDGVMIPIHIKNTELFETTILTQVRDIISGRSPDERLKMVELLRLRDEDIYVVFVERSASIVMYFYCISITGLERLHELWRNGCLTKHVETTFRRMTSQDVDMKLELEFNVVEYERLRKQLSEDEVDLEIAGGFDPEVAGRFEASSGFQADERPASLEMTEVEFLHMFWDLDKRVSACGEELHQSVDAHVQSLKDEVSSLRENFLELVQRRPVEPSNPSEEQKDVRKDRFRGPTVADRSLSTGCASRSEVQNLHSKSVWSSAEFAHDVYDTEKKLSSRKYQPTETGTEKVSDVCECVKLDDLDTKKQIPFGIAYFLEKFYVICLESNTILTYKSSSPFTLEEEEVTVEGLQSPYDIAASHSSLYVTDASNNCIWKIDSKHKSWCWMDEVGAPHTISVTPNQEVLLVCTGKPAAVRFFASDATLRRSICFLSESKKPTHAVATAEGHVIVSHGGVGSCEQEICEYSADGEFVRDFPSELAWPCHLAIDHVKGLVFVADFWSKRILVLNASLHPVAEITREHDSPWRLCYASDLQKLMVGASHTVEVYDVLAKV